MPSQEPRHSVPTSALEVAAWPALSEDLIELLAATGERIGTSCGDVLFDVGERSYDFYYVESGV
ncbi:MAG: cyclic nucleotide-binding protein, partial [Planctomycetota bacterium]